MKLKSFGCSFTWGCDLPDSCFSPIISSKLSWPAMLAKKFNLEYECHAYPGVGNFFIADRVLNHCSTSSGSNDLFVINWTFIDRFDYVIDNGQDPGEGSHELAIKGTPWQTCRPGDNSDYYRNYHSEYKDKLTSLQLVKLCIDTLQQQNIRFLMTALDELMFDQLWHTSAGIKLLQDYTLPHITKFNGQSFLDYVTSLGHTRTSSGHVDEHAHYDAAQCIINSFDIQNTICC